MQIVLDYGPANVTLYTNGAPAVTNTSGVSLWPSTNDRSRGMVIGNNTAYGSSINGQFDEMETFDYQLTAAEIAANFQTVTNVDSDLDGIPDLLEDIHLATARPFLGSPVVIAGTVEAEQFDMGSNGVGYYTTASNPASLYRPTGMFITNCNDLGLGYCLDQTHAGEWAQYTIHVLAGQTYTIETRVAGLGTSGVFQCDFTNNSGFYTNTGPLTITTTNWTNVSAVVYLPSNIYYMKLRFLTNGTDGTNVGRFNYISVYPYWTHAGPGPTQTNIPTSALSTNSDWGDAVANAAAIQSAINSLAGAGGTVVIPPGTYYVAQVNPNDANDAWSNAAVYITNCNVAIAGSNNPSLIAFDRSTALFSVGVNASQVYTHCTNFTLRDLTLVGQPHLVSTNSGSSYTNIYELGQLLPVGYNRNGTLVYIAGDQTSFPIQFMSDSLFSNCVFLHGDRSIAFYGYTSNCLITACTFLPWDSTNYWTAGMNSPPTQNTTNDGSWRIPGPGCRVWAARFQLKYTRQHLFWKLRSGKHQRNRRTGRICSVSGSRKRCRNWQHYNQLRLRRHPAWVRAKHHF